MRASAKNPFLRGFARESGAFFLFLLLSIGMTWPLALHLDRAYSDPGDPILNTWILEWVQRATLERLPLWDAPMFHPAPLTLAFSENLLGVAWLHLPLRWMGATPHVVYNVATLTGFAFSGYGAWLLVRVATGSSLAGVVGGVFFAFAPHRFDQLSHLQHIWAGWLPVLLAAAIGYGRRPGPARAALLGCAYVMNAITNMHLFAFGSAALALVLVVRAFQERRWKQPRFWAWAVAAVVLSLLLLMPMIRPYAAVSESYGRMEDADAARRYSATWSDWMVAAERNRLWADVGNGKEVDPERRLFPGAIIILLSIAALAGRPPWRSAVWAGVALIVLGVAASLGFNGWIHALLAELLPQFRGIRVPARWAVVAYAGLAVAGGFGVVALREKLSRGRGVATAGVLVLLLFELNAAPILWWLHPGTHADAYAWLATAPLQGALFEMPVYDDWPDIRYLYHATLHRRPLVNGYSRFRPPIHDAVAGWARSDPVSPRLLDFLESSGVAFVLVHGDWLEKRADEPVREWLRTSIREGRLTFIRRFDAEIAGDWLFGVTANAPLAAWLRPLGRDPAGRSAVENFRSFVDDLGLTYTDEPLVYLERAAQDGGRGPMKILGWTASPRGIRDIALLFENERVAIEPERLGSREDLRRHMPWYEEDDVVAFQVEIAERPAAVHLRTDLVVEVVDGAGRIERLGPRLLRWRD